RFGTGPGRRPRGQVDPVSCRGKREGPVPAAGHHRRVRPAETSRRGGRADLPGPAPGLVRGAGGAAGSLRPPAGPEGPRYGTPPPGAAGPGPILAVPA